MSFSSRRAKNKDIVASLSAEYREAAFWLPFDALEIKRAFSEEELSVVARFVDEMEEASSDNERQAKLAAQITEYGGVVVKLLKMAKVLPA
jgi:predicted KAP-like P-loop ATPase